jgi:hypothetical protein
MAKAKVTVHGKAAIKRRKALRRLPLPMLKDNLIKLSRIIREHPDNQ